MHRHRFHIYIQENYSYKLARSCRLWPEAISQALVLQNDYQLKTFIFDTQACSDSEDVFRLDTCGCPEATGHRSLSLYEHVRLMPIDSLVPAGVVEPLAVPGTVMLVKPLADTGDEAQSLTGVDLNSPQSDEFALLEAPFTRQAQEDNDIALMVYCERTLIATAVFSRYIEDHRFPIRRSELCYELSLHTVFVAEEYRGLGIATGLANTIVNIARQDMTRLHQVLTDANIRLKPWFSALALTPGGEAICDILSEAFVEMNDEVIEALMDDGVAVSYQEAEIFVESLA